jgi:Ca-activated chloride channel homolog
MISDFHFLRPGWFLTLIPLIALSVIFWQQNSGKSAWSDVCDAHLLKHLLQKKIQKTKLPPLFFLLISSLFMVISIAGPTWHKLPTPTYKPVQARVVLLDMSPNMMLNDLTPDRLSRAKFKLHDILERKNLGQIGLIVFTGEPFVVSPLTEDGLTISSLLSILTPDIMPVGGQRLDMALKEAKALIRQAGYRQGDILVLTADAPSSRAVETAKRLAEENIFSSIMPIKADKDLNPLFKQFANSGKGLLIPYSNDLIALEPWLKGKNNFSPDEEDSISLWRDEGAWFLIGALLFLLPYFQRGYLKQEIR